MNLKNILFGLLALAVVSGTVSAQIQAGKSINITISNVPDQDRATINNLYPVAENGTINMPLLNSPVRASGLKAHQLASLLETLYKNAGIYTNPTIQVIENREGGNVADEIVTVGGIVRRPGPVPFIKGLTLWQAIQAAGGPTDFGSMYRVTLFRDGKQAEYDVTKPQFMQIPLQRNDTIDVPQKNWRNR
ncbi:MAG: SLBB domain-containing protein [Akkermansiaceae bacterium]